VAKTKPPDNSKLKEGLLKAVTGEAVQATGTGKSPGIFGTAKAADTLFERARELGYIEPCDGPPVKGKAKSKPKYARITAEGRTWVLGEASPREVLHGLAAALNKQREAFGQDEFDLAHLQRRLAELQRSHEELQRSVGEVAARRREEVSQLQASLEFASSTVARAVAEVAELVGKPGPAASGKDLGVETETYVREWRNQRGAGCPLPELFKHLKERSPALTIGEFHDLLRSLYDHRRIRLTGWHDSPDRMPEPNLALFVSSKVIYYADAPDASP
jgi:hypothetical protein